jgi:hypothetical protein
MNTEDKQNLRKDRRYKVLEDKYHRILSIITEKDQQIENLKSVMVAAAEEIMLHWQAHCDEDGYGPSSLLNRLEKGLASNYSGYKAGNIEKMNKEIEALKQALKDEQITGRQEWERLQISEVDRLKAENIDLKQALSKCKYLVDLFHSHESIELQLDIEQLLK